MLATLTGTGLAAAAGLNAYIPLLLLGLFARFTDLLSLPAGWAWLAHPVVLWVLAGLLALELVVDKIPGADSINDVVQTVVRPAAGGITFSAGSASFTLSQLTESPEQGTVWGFVAGAVVALLLHGLKALSRPLINAASFGAGGAVTSTVEDASSFTLAVLAVLIPLTILLLLPGLVLVLLWMLRMRRRTKRTDTGHR